VSLKPKKIDHSNVREQQNQIQAFYMHSIQPSVTHS